MPKMEKQPNKREKKKKSIQGKSNRKTSKYRQNKK